MAANITVTETSTSVSSIISDSTTTFTSGSSTITSVTSSAVPITSTFVTTSYVSPVTSSVILYTSVVTETPSSTGGTDSPTVVFVTSTATPTLTSNSQYYYSPTASSSPTSKASALATAAASSSSSSGLSSGGTIAIAVVVPIVAIIAFVLASLFFWKRHKAREAAKEQRKKEIEEYGFNPNRDPILPAPGGATYPENRSEMAEQDNGYRGWRTTSSTQRKPSTHISSGRGGVAGAVSDSSSNPGGYAYQQSPSNRTELASEGHSGDPLVAGGGDAAAAAAAAAGVGGAAIGMAVEHHQSNSGQRDMHRGPSNASSAYSTGQAHSQTSEDGGEYIPPVGGGAPGMPGPYYHEEGPYANYPEGQQPHAYGGEYGQEGGQPVIRDLQAKRNTRIERVPPFPNQGSAGIAQNF